MMKKFLFPLLSLLAAALFPCSLHGQYLGQVSPQTVQATPFNAVLCTGGTQVSSFIPNLGQTQHTISLTPTATDVSAFAEASYDGTTFFTASDVIRTRTSATAQVTFSAYYPVMRVNATCAAASGSFTVNYSGTSVTPGGPAGSSLNGTIGKNITGTAPSAGSNFSLTISTPFGTSNGQIRFFYSGAGPSGSTLTLTCVDPIIGGSPVVAAFSLTTSASLQIFTVPALACTQVFFSYVSGGASAQTFSAAYIFFIPGIQGGAGLDPCAWSGTQKSTAVITAGAAATTQIVAPVTGAQVYVCGYQLSQGAAASFQWITGTGATCGGATVNKTGVITTLSGSPFTYGPGSTIFSAAPGSGVCIITVGAGGTANGILTFVQQ
jgi:hypothetical protein